MAHEHHDMSIANASDRKTLSSYIVGLGLSIVLTLMAFGLVGKRIFSDKYSYIVLALLAVIQLIVQAVCFLRLNNSREGQWNLMPFLFTLFIIAILVCGSLWIMYNLNYYMMN